MSVNVPSPEQCADAALERVLGGLRPGTDESFAAPSASVAFLTVQAARHAGRSSGYVNTVLSVRVGSAVGSCAAEPGELGDDVVREIAGEDVASLIRHPIRAVRVATADAYLADAVPHARHWSSRAVRIPAGTSLEKSLARARAVVDLVRVPAGGRVAVIGVVNSVLAVLRERGIDYVPCDLKGGSTEWGEPVVTDHREALRSADAVLASGMMLGNGTFDDLVVRCGRRNLPLAMFAQSGSAVLREMVGREITALSAEPYPFFWLDGDDTDIHVYAGDLP